MTRPPDLDAEQLSAASAPPETRQVVLAPPGSGKTEVVAALLLNLADEHELVPTDEVLVLSFSRAAVAAVRRRAHSDSRAVAIRTLDSCASRILEDVDDEEWQHLSFDARVSRAVALLRQGRIPEELGLIRHLVVDEVQDLVGTRAELVVELLKHLTEGAGFTLLGDPRQAVYNFQLESGVGMSSEEFLETARSLGDVREITLKGQYRARSREASAAAQLGGTYGGAESWLREVRSFVSRLFLAGDVEDLAAHVGRWQGSTVFLCRTNGEALITASKLRDAGLAVSARAAAEDLPVASWVGEALSRTDRSKIRRSELPALLEQVTTAVPEDPWRVLKSVERDFRSSDRLDLRALATRIANGDVPADLLAETSRVQVSTIHRAKGLEFDNVVLVNADDLLPGGADQDDAAVAYVALTRPRDQIMTARCALPRNLRIDKGTGRWIVGGHKHWQTWGFEIRGVDTRAGDPVEHGLAADSLQVGAPVRLEPDPLRSTMEVPVYSVLLDEREVARTSLRFGELLARRIGPAGRRRVPWPALHGLAVESLETVGVPSPLGGGPLIGLGVRVSGMATLDWGNDGGANSA